MKVGELIKGYLPGDYTAEEKKERRLKPLMNLGKVIGAVALSLAVVLPVGSRIVDKCTIDSTRLEFTVDTSTNYSQAVSDIVANMLGSDDPIIVKAAREINQGEIVDRINDQIYLYTGETATNQTGHKLKFIVELDGDFLAVNLVTDDSAESTNETGYSIVND